MIGLLLLGCLVSDGDGDGIPQGADCDDGDAAVGLALRWYPDSDGDGWGVYQSDPPLGCWGPAGTADQSGDCDDTDPDVAPEIPELCDGVDQDCDGLVDEDAVGTRSWYLDSDGDGFGTEVSLRVQCPSPGVDFTNEGGDCDDTDRAIWPGALEFCDGIDTDCDGGVDDPSCPPMSQAGWADGKDRDSNYGWAVAGVLDGDRGSMAVGSPFYEAWGRVDQMGVGSLSLEAEVSGREGASVGYALASGDFDGDGRGDLASGQPCVWQQDCRGESGVVLLLSGNAPSWTEGARRLVYGAERAAMGSSLAVVDGVAVLAGAPETMVDGERAGAAWLFEGADGGEVGARGLVVTGAPGGQLGTDVAAGDLDGDGLDELLLGDGDGDGAVYVIAGGLAGDRAVADAGGALLGSAGVSVGGRSVAVDLDGDGYRDLVADTWYDDKGHTGAVMILRGPVDGVTQADQIEDRLIHSLWDGGGELALAELALENTSELAVGSWSYDTVYSEAGAVFLVHGPIEGSQELLEGARSLHGGHYNEGMGGAVAAEDLDGDGLPELLVGAPGGRGAAYLFPGAALY